MHRYSRLLATIVFLGIFIPGLASAHVLKTDGTIGAVMHIEPADDPAAHQQATFYFDIKDTANAFSFTLCSCEVQIKQGSLNIFSTSLNQTVPGTGAFSYTFLARGDYTVELIGVPLQPKAFQPFTLNYPVSVARDVNTPEDLGQIFRNYLGPILAGGIIIAVIGLVALPKKRPPEV